MAERSFKSSSVLTLTPFYTWFAEQAERKGVMNFYKVCRLRCRQGYEKHRTLQKGRETSIGSVCFQFPKPCGIVYTLIISRFYGLCAFAKGDTFSFLWQLLIMAQVLDVSTRPHIARHK